MNAVTCGQLAEMIEAVSDKDTNDVSIETAIEDIRDADMAIVEWLCRLIPETTIAALRAHANIPMWGDGSAKPEQFNTRRGASP